MQIDQVVAELLARGDMNDDTVIELNHMLDSWRAGTLDPEDDAYIRALHARVMNLTLEPEQAVAPTANALDGLTIETDREREGDLGRAVGHGEVRQLLPGDDVVLAHLLRRSADRRDADAPGPARPYHLLDGLLDGPFPLVEKLPLAGRLVPGDVARLLKRQKRRLDLVPQRCNVSRQIADE